MIQTINSLLRAVLSGEPQPEKRIIFRDDAVPGEWNMCETTRPIDGETVVVATRETYPEPWGRAMKAFGLNGWMMIARSSDEPVGVPVWWRYE